MSFCSNCGTQMPQGASFCPSCGNRLQSLPVTPLEQQSAVPQTPAAPVSYEPQVTHERVLGIVPFAKKMKFTGYDSYAVVVTERRMILAQMTSQMLKDAVKEAQERGKAEGKGFMERWGDQMKASFTYAQKYWNIPPESILRETPGNFAIENQDIFKIEIDEKNRNDNRAIADNWEMKIESRSGKYSYMFDGGQDERDMLKQVYGERVKFSGLYLEKKIGPGRLKFKIGI